MKLIPRNSVMHNLFNRRRATTISSFISAINLFVGIFVLMFIVVIQESRHRKEPSFEFETNMEYVQINNGQAMPAVAKEALKKRSLNDYYFRIDYTIKEAICQPVNVFYTKNAVNTIRTMTVDELNGILPPNMKVNLNILRINGILKSSERIIEPGINKTEKLICTYILELFTVINFPSHCDHDCQKTQLHTITANKNVFGDLPNSSLKFSLPDISLPDEPLTFRIFQVDIAQTAKYLDKALFIQSASETRFVSTKYFHSNVNQSLVSVSTRDKSLFIMKKGLEILDSSSVCVSFLSLSMPNLYLRHEEGKLKLVKYDSSILYRQDATFKLIVDQRNDAVQFQTINLPTKYAVAVSGDPEPILILMPADEEPKFDKADPRFFKLIAAS